MIPLQTFFFAMLVLFGIIGALRGWAKELLVIFSVVLARFIEFVLVSYIPIFTAAWEAMPPETRFYVRLPLLVMIVSFGYATTAVSKVLGQRARKEKFEDTLLGLFLGILNGYFIIGMVWGFLDDLGYNVWGITPPVIDTAAVQIVNFLPLQYLQGPTLFVAVALSFAFVLIVFV